MSVFAQEYNSQLADGELKFEATSCELMMPVYVVSTEQEGNYLPFEFNTMSAEELKKITNEDSVTIVDSSIEDGKIIIVLDLNFEEIMIYNNSMAGDDINCNVAETIALIGTTNRFRAGEWQEGQ